MKLMQKALSLRKLRKRKYRTMQVSYHWLKEYLTALPSVAALSEILTNTGLEVGGIEKFESVKGGLKGLVIGEVLTKEKHPDADRLSLTTVNIGEEVLAIVCGAPNVAVGQKVVVATVGTTLYSGDDSFVIKKSKIRACESHGMLCAEDEIGLGVGHDGIMVLPEDLVVGTPAADYFGVVEDQVLDIDLTPNRIDGASHLGVCRDVAAYLATQGEHVELKVPSVDHFAVDNHDCEIDVKIEDTAACIRYAGLTLTDVEVKESPAWLKNRIRSIGLTPINNVVDITNYVLFETGQPLHAFDAAKVGKQVFVKTMPEGTRFVTLDEKERKLGAKDLMICNAQEAMCMAGVMGGLHSGVSQSTTSVFLESACFDPVSVRKTAKAHGLNSDSSFRFERGVDPNGTLYALKRAALLIKELAGASISSEIVDIYPKEVLPAEVHIKWAHVDRLIGLSIPRELLRSILKSLDICLVSENDEGACLSIPTYRVDVLREADVIEEILRIYGYNRVDIGNSVKSTLVFSDKPDRHHCQNIVSNMLSANGFFEIMCNSLNKQNDYEGLEKWPAKHLVEIINPLSQELNIMRQSLLFGGLETIAYNQNRKRNDLKLYEFGQSYFYDQGKEALKKYSEKTCLACFVTGKRHAPSWFQDATPADCFELKAYVGNVLKRLGFDFLAFDSAPVSDEIFVQGRSYSKQGQVLVTLGYIQDAILKKAGVKGMVSYAEINWDALLKMTAKQKVLYRPISKFPEVKRDLSMLIDQDLDFASLEQAAYKVEKKLLKEVNLFDVYEGKNLPAGKKSYALSFILQDQDNTLTDNQINKVMKRLVDVYVKDFNAEIRDGN